MAKMARRLSNLKPKRAHSVPWTTSCPIAPASSEFCETADSMCFELDLSQRPRCVFFFASSEPPDTLSTHPPLNNYITTGDDGAGPR